jgi:hypothetical protein
MPVTPAFHNITASSPEPLTVYKIFLLGVNIIYIIKHMIMVHKRIPGLFVLLNNDNIRNMLYKIKTIKHLNAFHRGPHCHENG